MPGEFVCMGSGPPYPGGLTADLPRTSHWPPVGVGVGVGIDLSELAGNTRFARLAHLAKNTHDDGEQERGSRGLSGRPMRQSYGRRLLLTIWPYMCDSEYKRGLPRARDEGL